MTGLLVALLLGCPRPPIAEAPPPACAAPALPVETVYYDVSGTTRDELRASVDANGPGRPWVGLTTSDFAWRCRQDVAPDGTKTLSGVDVDAAITVRMPRWTPPRGASRELVAEWDEWMRVTAVHEQGHVDVAQRWLRCAADELAAQPSCDVARSRVEAVLRAMEAEQRAYDEATQHGILQGSVF